VGAQSKSGAGGGRGRTVAAQVADQAGTEPAARNEVLLVGRLSAEPEERQLPSGDVLLLWRLVVDRPKPLRPAPEGVRLPTVDALVCVAWSARVRRTAAGWHPGDVVEVQGSLRQRFWRAGAGLGSRTEVEVAAARRLVRAAA
jgi:single-strand DNA-binding protein